MDDDEGVLKTLEAILTSRGFQVSAVSSVPEALELVSTQPFDVLLSDLNVGQPGDGFTVVSAMRRVQPRACTFILTGYPDFESAIKAIQNQVDGYFCKPLEIEELLKSISAVQSGDGLPLKTKAPQSVAALVSDHISVICERWLQEILIDPEIAALPLTPKERIDHIPELLDEVVRRLERQSLEMNPDAAEAARQHGRTRFQQGYTIPQILFGSRVLQSVLTSVIQENILRLELSTLIHDILAIGQHLQSEVEFSIRAYQAQIPRSLQASFSILYKSPSLGVAILNEDRILDANDALLRMIGYSREQLLAGGIDWRAMTPRKFHPADATATEQLREFGTCAPFEKEFLLPDGSSLPVLVGAVRLRPDPLEWSVYMMDLTEQRRAGTAEQEVREWESRHNLINQLAHEINNPLAALTFSNHLLGSHPALTDDMRSLVRDDGDMLARIAETVRKVLIESRP